MNRPKWSLIIPPRNTGKTILVEHMNELNKYIDFLEKALEEACFDLAIMSSGVDENSWNYLWDYEDWKEWLMKDE